MNDEDDADEDEDENADEDMYRRGGGEGIHWNTERSDYNEKISTKNNYVCDSGAEMKTKMKKERHFRDFIV